MLTTVRFWFPVLLATIVAISLYDTLLIVLFRDSIGLMEKNPIGLWLIRLGAGDVEIFVRAKLAGTLLVATVLFTMYRCRACSAIPVTTSIAAFQVSLLAYLTFA